MSGWVARVYHVTWHVREYHLASTVALVRLLVQYDLYLHSLCSVIVTYRVLYCRLSFFCPFEAIR
jgi:hypothetical protein